MLPRRSQALLDFATPAAARDEVWRTVLTVLATVFSYLVIISGLSFAVIYIGESIQLGFGYRILFDIQSGQGGWQALTQLGLIGLLLLPFWGFLRLLHRRPLRTLLGPGGTINWRHFEIASIFVLLLSLPDFLLSSLFGQLTPALPLDQWLVWLVPALTALSLQVLAEEMVFRGFLMQQLAARFRSRWVWWVLPSLLFGSLHWNPTAFGPGPALVVVITTAFMGLVLSDVTARFGNLGPALGLHFANNLTVLLLVGVPQQLSGLSLYERDLPTTQPDSLLLALISSMGLMVFVYFIYMLIMKRRGL